MPVSSCTLTMKAELITDMVGVAGIEDEWRALAEQRANAFVTPEWFASWWEGRSDAASPLIATVRREDDSLAGVMPLVLDSGRRPRAIHFAGSKWGDRFSPACEEADEGEVAAATMAALREADLDRYILVLDHIDVERPWWREMQAAAGRKLAGVEQQHFEVPYIGLEGLDWDGYLASRSRNFRQQLRKRERNLRSDHQVEVRSATEESLDDDLSEFFSLHERRWEERGRSSLEQAGTKEFLGRFAAAAQRRGWLRLRLLEVDGAPVAAFLGWRLGDTYSFYQSGFDPAWSDKSVGIVLMAMTIRSAIEEGAGEFDLLLGTEAYKDRLKNESRSLHTMTLARGPARLLLAAEARARRYGRGLAGRPVFSGLARRLRRFLPTSRST